MVHSKRVNGYVVGYRFIYCLDFLAFSAVYSLIIDRGPIIWFQSHSRRTAILCVVSLIYFEHAPHFLPLL